MRSTRGVLAIMALLLAVDQALKVWVRLEVPMFHSTRLLPHLLDLTHVENRGVSFSFLGDLTGGVRVPLLAGISILAVLALSVYWARHRQRLNLLAHLGFVLILPGAAGNLIDRVVFGTVTDYLHFRFYDTSFFVNNFADILISAGVVAYILGALPLLRQPDDPPRKPAQRSSR